MPGTHLAKDANAEARPGEGVAKHYIARQAHLQAQGAHFILKQLAQGLHQLELPATATKMSEADTAASKRSTGSRATSFRHQTVTGASAAEASA
jgi:hypothetical protein